MTMKENPDLEDALDGLQNAEGYCEDHGFNETARELAELYQRVGRLAPDEDWDDVTEEELEWLD